ncbi:MAG: hypothetical protein VX938_08420, partial [Myxococcota bacterium]|nr:hypothetical protein [Myxococcota bacterium]
MSSDSASRGPLIQENHVVYLAVGGSLLAARVSGQQGSRLVTAGLDGVSRVVSPARLYWGGMQRVADDAALQRHWEDVSSRAPQCDLKLGWQLLADDGALDDL